jgi:hypothetical protein
MSAGSSMKINSLPAKSGFCKNLTKKKSQQLFSIFFIVGTLNGLIWWNKKKCEYFHLTWDSRFLQAVALNGCIHIRCTLSKLNDCTHILCALSSLYSKYPSHVSKLSNLIGIEIQVYCLHAAVGQCAGQSRHLIVLNSKALKIFS